MSREIAAHLFETGRAHALAADRLYRAAFEDGMQRSPDDPELFAFNGTYSLSVYYLVCLGLELMLKAAYVGVGGPSDNASLRSIGHSLVSAFDAATAMGFQSIAPRLIETIASLKEPYKAHFFRYDRPDAFLLPTFPQLIDTLLVLDEELRALCEE